MVYQNFCNGCKKKSLIKVNFNNLQICKNCLLVSRKIDSKFIKSLKKTFTFNKGYSFSTTNYKGRSEKNFYFFEKLSKITNISRKDEILDFGSGYGALLEILNRKKYKVIGIEPSIKNYKISKKLNHKVLNKYLNSNTFKQNRFKIIVSLYVFTYIYNISEILNIFNKILKNNGYVLIRVHKYKFSNSYRKYNDFEIQNGVPNHFSNHSLKNLFTIHNFSIILLESNVNGTTIIAKKINKKINYKRSGIIGFEIFYLKYLTFYIANIMHFILLLKIKIRNILKNG
jgi:2-polyprenyl-3-methyl-5-hydroxy-6-metoxy-1,4-benzoquinol methylase